MSNGVIEIRESEFNEMKSSINKTMSKTDNFSNQMSTLFKDATRVGLLNESTDKIGKQLFTISSHLGRMENTLSKTYDNMSILEKQLTEKANEITVPNDFYKNDSSHEVSINYGQINKEDGKKININNGNNEKDLVFNNVLDYNDKIKKIVKDYEEKNKEIEIEGNIVDLINIKKKQISISDSSEESIIEKEVLDNISKKINENNPEFDDNFELKKIYLESIKNIDTTQVDYDDLYLNIKKELLKKINNGDYILKRYEE